MSQQSPPERTAIDALCAQGREALRSRAFETAIVRFREVLTQDDFHVGAQEGLAMAFALGKDYENAATQFERLTQIAPAKIATLINLGAIYNRLERYDKAVECLQKALHRDQSCSQGFYNLGIAYRRLGRSAMALSAYREAIRLDPGMSEAHLNLGNVFIDLNNPQQALVHYKKALEIRPDFPAAEEGRRTALRLIDQAERDRSPFGRLVDPTQYLDRRPEEKTRVLTEEERQKDRERLQMFSCAIENATKYFVEHLRDDLAPRLIAIQRLFAAGREYSADFRKQRTELQKSIKDNIELRRKIRDRMLQLKAHQELMREPTE